MEDFRITTGPLGFIIIARTGSKCNCTSNINTKSWYFSVIVTSEETVAFWQTCGDGINIEGERLVPHLAAKSNTAHSIVTLKSQVVIADRCFVICKPADTAYNQVVSAARRYEGLLADFSGLLNSWNGHFLMTWQPPQRMHNPLSIHSLCCFLVPKGVHTAPDVVFFVGRAWS